MLAWSFFGGVYVNDMLENGILHIHHIIYILSKEYDGGKKNLNKKLHWWQFYAFDVMHGKEWNLNFSVIIFCYRYLKQILTYLNEVSKAQNKMSFWLPIYCHISYSLGMCICGTLFIYWCYTYELYQVVLLPYNLDSSGLVLLNEDRDIYYTV